VEAGADYLDVNCGTQAHDELATMEWLVNSIQEAVQVPLCVDSPDIGAVQVGLRLVRYGRPLINSVTAEQEVLRKVLPVIKEHEARIIALCMDEKGIPKTARDRFAVAERLVSDLTVLST
jgi:5-methyltetrahydrofolate--homocysteine methyltransferase